MCQPWSYGAITRSDTETDADTDKLTQSPMGLVLVSFISVQYEHLHTFLSNPFFISVGVGVVITVFLQPATKLGQGYVFTGVCDSVHMGGSAPGGPAVGGGSGDLPRVGYCCRRYASYWDAFLFILCLHWPRPRPRPRLIPVPVELGLMIMLGSGFNGPSPRLMQISIISVNILSVSVSV